MYLRFDTITFLFIYAYVCEILLIVCLGIGLVFCSDDLNELHLPRLHEKFKSLKSKSSENSNDVTAMEKITIITIWVNQNKLLHFLLVSLKVNCK